MILLHHESFDRYSSTGAAPGLQAKYNTTVGTGSTLSLPAGRLGGQCLQFAITLNNPCGAQRALASAQSTFCFHGALRMTSLPSSNSVGYILSFLNNTTYQLGFRVSSLGELVVYRASGASAGTELGRTATNVIHENAWHFLKIYMVISDTVGEVIIRIDNNVELTLSGQDTKNHASLSTVDQVIYGTLAAGGSAVNQTGQWDDCYISDGDILPEGTLFCSNPTGDAVAGFTRSTGATNYGTVDEDPVSTADYNESAVIGTADLFDMEDLASTPKTIMAVILTAVARKTDAGDRALGLRVKSGATTSEGPDNWLGTSSLHYDRILYTDPNTGVAWTAAAVNALQAGYKVNA